MHASTAPRHEFEWPTWLLWFAIMGAWLALLAGYGHLPQALSTPLLIVLLAWYVSLQHELTHGHPTRSATLNRLLGLAPLAVWYPFDTYKTDHLIHHNDARLTEPGIDTESNYLTPAQAATLGPLALWLARSQRTVLGRLLLGPALVNLSLWKRALRRLRSGDRAELRVWSVHLPLVVILLWGLQSFTAIDPWFYCLAIAYPALGLAMLRSLYEHRPATLPAHRTVINEAAAPWRLLYLNNNYHVVHHVHPGLPWYRIPARYRAERESFLARNGGFVLPGYLHLLRHHALRPVDEAVLPAPATPGTPARGPVPAVR